MIRFHLYAFVAGFILDLIIGDPHFLYHPVRAIGKFVSFLEKKLDEIRLNKIDLGTLPH